MRNLRELDILPSYASLDPGFLRFYSNCLRASVEYSRGVGFFSSSAWDVLLADFQGFARRGGRIQYVASPHVSERDAQLLRELASRLSAPPAHAAGDDGFSCKNGSQLLQALVLAGVLELRFARPIPPLGPGLYHEKIALFRDTSGDFIAFSGSLNETGTALVRNYERIEVYRSWDPRDELRALTLHAHFQALWIGVPGLEVRTLARAVEWLEPMPRSTTQTADPDQVVDAPPLHDGDRRMSESSQPRLARVPEDVHLREHQTKAIADWLKAGMRGILRMATGSGKTITALTAAVLVAQRSQRLLVVVICPYTHLVDQWAYEAKRFGFDPVACYGSRRTWQRTLARRLGLLDREAERLLMVITTQATFAGEALGALLTSASAKRLIIADEVHGMGAKGQIDALQEAPIFDYRMGLSATPERWFDPEGTADLVTFFGPMLADYTLESALKDKVLVPYSYYPELIELEGDEHESYSSITRRIGALLSQESRVDANDPKAKQLLMARARLLAGARNKIPHLRTLLLAQRVARLRVSHTLVYCGDGRVETDETASETDESRYVEVVADLMNFDLGISCAVYVAETRLERRLQLQRDLASGKLEAIVAIRCLDEGVDIPSARSAYILASSRNPRQFIQRRGRILRRDDASGKDNADIFDFVVVPPDTSDELAWKVDRALLRNELRRIVEFSKLSRNEGLALRRLRPLRERYDLLGFNEGDASELINT